MILDSTFLIDLLKGNDEVHNILDKLYEEEIIKTTSISIFEIFKARLKKIEIDNINKLFDNIISLDFDRKAGKLSGEIYRELKLKGKTIDPEDCMIAAIAILNNDSLLTKNKKHFERISGLKLVSY